MIKRVGIFIVLIILALCVISCSKKQDETVLSRDFQGEIWSRFDYIEASYNVLKAPMTGYLVLNLEVSDVYPDIYQYHSDDDGRFSIVLSINGPDGSRRVREFNFKLKDKEGNFKSEKVDGYYHYELPLINGMSFNTNGEYRFKIENHHKKDPLYGIKSLNIKCLQIKTNK